MNINRRSFIKNLGATAFAVACFGATRTAFGQVAKTNELFAVPPESSSDPLSYLTRQQFEPFVNTFVKVQTGEGRVVELELIEVTKLSSEANEKTGFSGESFSLLFESRKKTKLPQETYQVRFDYLGEMTLLLVPVGRSKNRYEAVINRISQTTAGQ